MANLKPDTKGLTRGNGRALKALGVEPLEPHEVSFVVRVRGDKDLAARLKGMTPKEVGEVIRLGLELCVCPKSSSDTHK